MALRWWHPRAALLALLLALPVLVAGCTIKLIADYDEQIDTAATELQQSMDRFLSELRQTVRPRQYGPSADFYVQYAVAVRSVRIRASTHEKNRSSIAQYDLMLRSLEILRQLHDSQDDLSDGAIESAIDEFNLAWTSIISLEVAKKRGGS
jgi:muramidase (phage lysozyme)